MSKKEKLRRKLYKKPAPNDLLISEVISLAKAYGCKVESGGKHPIKIIYPRFGMVIPIPRHGDTVDEAYIRQIKDLIDRIESEGEQA